MVVRLLQIANINKRREFTKSLLKNEMNQLYSKSVLNSNSRWPLPASCECVHSNVTEITGKFKQK
jgi:hypothetical protein